MSKLVQDALGGDEGDDDVEMSDESSAARKELLVKNVDSAVLQKIIEFCTYYKQEDPMTELKRPLKSDKMSENVQPWYAEFADNLDQTMLFQLVLAANYMDIKPLLDLASGKIALIIKGKTCEEIRELFNIENDFTPEEMAEVKKEDKWSGQS